MPKPNHPYPCEKCDSKTLIIDSRAAGAVGGSGGGMYKFMYRRRECTECGYVMPTAEVPYAQALKYLRHLWKEAHRKAALTAIKKKGRAQRKSVAAKVKRKKAAKKQAKKVTKKRKKAA
jgi:hypothetical protein